MKNSEIKLYLDTICKKLISIDSTLKSGNVDDLHNDVQNLKSQISNIKTKLECLEDKDSISNPISNKYAYPEIDNAYHTVVQNNATVVNLLLDYLKLDVESGKRIVKRKPSSPSSYK